MNELLQCYIYGAHPRTLHNQARLLLWCDIKSLAYEIVTITECMLVSASCMTLTCDNGHHTHVGGGCGIIFMQEKVPVTSSYHLGKATSLVGFSQCMCE